MTARCKVGSGMVWERFRRFCRPGVRFKAGSGGSGVVQARCKVQGRFRRFGVVW